MNTNSAVSVGVIEQTIPDNPSEADTSLVRNPCSQAETIYSQDISQHISEVFVTTPRASIDSLNFHCPPTM